MRRLLAIAHNTWREAIRDRILYSILFFAALIIAASVLMQEITIGDADKVVRSVALGAIRFFGSVIALFLGIGLVWKELERKTIYTIASKPIPRWLFILGKYLGLMGVILTNLALMSVLYAVVIGLQQGLPGVSVWVSLGVLVFELGLLTAWSLLYSTYSGPTTAAAFALATWVIGNLADDIRLFGEQMKSEAARQVAEVLYWVLPNFSLFDLGDYAVHGLPLPWGQVWGALAYGIGYTTVVLVAATWIFGRRDFR